MWNYEVNLRHYVIIFFMKKIKRGGAEAVVHAVGYEVAFPHLNIMQ